MAVIKGCVNCARDSPDSEKTLICQKGEKRREREEREREREREREKQTLRFIFPTTNESPTGSQTARK